MMLDGIRWQHGGIPSTEFSSLTAKRGAQTVTSFSKEHTPGANDAIYVFR